MNESTITSAQALGQGDSWPPSILIGLYYYQPYISGLSEYARQLAEGLAESGYEVTVLCLRHESSSPRQESIRGVRVIRAPNLFRYGKGAISPLFWCQLVRLGNRHDVVNLHLPLPDAGLVAGFLPRDRLLVTYHCDVNLGDGLVNRLIEHASYSLMERALRRATVIVGNSAAYFRNSRFAEYSPKFRAVNPPIDTRRFRPTAASSRSAARNEPYRIGFVGRVVYEKGLQYLFDAIPTLQESIGELQVLVVGETEGVAGGSVMPELERYRARFPDIIRFLGRIGAEELVRFYSDIDILVLPSIDPLESFGMVQVEAMCCGTPVVASNLPGVNEVIGKTGFGRLARPRDPDDIARQIELVRRGQFTRDGFDPREWDVANTISTYMELIEELRADNGSVACPRN